MWLRSHGKGWLRAVQSTPDLKATLKVVGLVDLNPDTAKALASEFDLGQAVIGTDLRAVLEETKADIVLMWSYPLRDTRSSRQHLAMVAMC